MKINISQYRKAFTFLLLSVLLLSLSSASGFNVVFNGDFKNGTTLYSDTLFISSGSIPGKDVYKDRSSATSELICTDKNITYKDLVCNTTTTYTTRTVRVRNGYNITYETISIPRTKRTCEYVEKSKIVTSCKKVRIPIGCINSDEKYSNQLQLENFKYSTDLGATWNNIPYGYDALQNPIQIENKNVQFKVDIPKVCSPKYLINDAITVSG